MSGDGRISRRALFAMAGTAAAAMAAMYLAGPALEGAIRSTWTEWATGYRYANLDRLKAAVKRVDISAEPLASGLIIVLFDGVRADYLTDLAAQGGPVAQMLAMSAFFPNGRVYLPSYSQPSRASWISGAPPEIHGKLSNADSGPLAVENIFSLARERGYRTYAINDFYMDRLLRGVLDRQVDLPTWFGGGGTAFAEAMDMLPALRGQRFVMWINWKEPDLIGHSIGTASPDYRNAISLGAYNVLRLVERLRELGMYDDTLVVLYADHGFKLFSHGGDEPYVVRTWTAFLGPRAVPGTYEEGFRQGDVVATLSMYMGLPIPQLSIGLPLARGLSVPQDRLQLYAEAARRQSTAVVQALCQVEGCSPPAVQDVHEAYRSAVLQLASRRL